MQEEETYFGISPLIINRIKLRIQKDLTRLSVCMEDGKARDHE
ncbi:hypothetical protein [Paenibacillus sp. Soil750]|nr:hypothetical protein [Paenibacillus sp. Soil750]